MSFVEAVGLRTQIALFVVCVIVLALPATDVQWSNVYPDGVVGVVGQ